MLKNKTYQSYRGQNKEADYSKRSNGSSNNGLFTELSSVPEFLPVRTNQKSSDSRVTGSQVARSNHSFANKTAFGKVLSFGFVGHESGVSRWRRSSPRLEGLLFGFQGERVLGVNSDNGAPAKKNISKDVFNVNTIFSNSNTWIPEQEPRHKANPHKDPTAGYEQINGLDSQSNYSEGGEYETGNGDDSARSGVDDMLLHSPSVPYQIQSSEAGAS
jgi:hypothetical protein